MRKRSLLSTFYLRRTASSGQALLGVVVLFTVIISTVVAGAVLPIVRQLQETKDLLLSEQSYLAAESSGEDVLYRLERASPVSSVEVLAVASAWATTTITTVSVPPEQEILSSGAYLGDVRNTKIVLAQGSGIAFNYGTQSGNGGFVIGNNAGVYGNVYANGNISGANGAFVTGTAVAANSEAATADQTNDSPMPPQNTIVFGQTASAQDAAQSFEIASSAPASSASFYIEKTGNPSDITVRLTADAGGAPAASALASVTLPASQVTGSLGWVNVPFPAGVPLAASTTYWLVADASNSTNNYYALGANGAYAGGTALVGKYGGSWSGTSPSGLDAYFRFYTGGQTSTIDNVDIGQSGTGDAWAHTVDDSTIAGNLYCQSGAGDAGKTCDASKGDPSPQGYPVSQSNIDDWKAAAAAGTVISGDKSISSPASLGPAEITGNLSIGATLTLTGVVYVQGTITTQNNAQIKLDSSFGGDGTILLSDGRIDLGNGVQFVSNGSGSYILLLTTSDCPGDASCGGSPAMYIANNVGTVILNAQSGTIELKNGASANEITADTIQLDPNSSVTYLSGLASQVFSTGPSGGYQIASWSEVAP